MSELGIRRTIARETDEQSPCIDERNGPVRERHHVDRRTSEAGGRDSRVPERPIERTVKRVADEHRGAIAGDAADDQVAVWGRRRNRWRHARFNEGRGSAATTEPSIRPPRASEAEEANPQPGTALRDDGQTVAAPCEESDGAIVRTDPSDDIPVAAEAHIDLPAGTLALTRRGAAKRIGAFPIQLTLLTGLHTSVSASRANCDEPLWTKSPRAQHTDDAAAAVKPRHEMNIGGARRYRLVPVGDDETTIPPSVHDLAGRTTAECGRHGFHGVG